MLTNQQLQHYETFGFVTLQNLFSPSEVETLQAEFENELDYVYANKPFTGEKRYWTMMLNPRTPLFYSLLEDNRLCSIAEQLYGDDVIGIGCDSNRYVGDTKWHSDHAADPTEDSFGVKFAFYLDAVDANSGALRLIPGSHRRAFHYDLKTSLPSLELDVNDIPAHVCTANPGDVVAFDMRCWHASHGGSAGRRMSTCVYYNNPKGKAEEAAARKRAIGANKVTERFGRQGDPVYSCEWLENKENSPKRQRWLGRMAELGYFDLPEKIT